MADYSDLQEFVMPPPGNTCNVSGAWIEAGDLCYATSYDAVRTGGAICADVARPAAPTVDIPPTVDTPAGGK
jgi:hypothetical protein